VKRLAFQLVWLGVLTSMATARPIVPGYEHLHEQATDDAARRAAGEVLLGELNCIACHAVDDTIRKRLDPKPAPNLSAVGKRLHGQPMAAFIGAPHGFKPGTTMPDFGLSDKEAAAVAAFLRGKDKPREPSRMQAAPERGERLFASIGCATCHPVPGKPPQDAETPIGLGGHYGYVALTDFIENPLAVRPGGRMPHMQLEGIDARDIAIYLIRNRPSYDPANVPDDVSKSLGEKLFTERGCNACHDRGDGLNAPPNVKPLQQVNPQASAGCLGDSPRIDYQLSADQKKALTLAVQHLQGDHAAKLTAAEHVDRTLARFNCYACHTRGAHGPADSNLQHFDGDPDIGDEGRYPPTLSGIGAKLRRDWLKHVLADGSHVRPYLKTRMPIFGAGNLDGLADHLIEVDGGSEADPAKVFAGGDIEAGRTLMGITGMACITCHELRDRASIGIGALNLATVPRRLQAEYFRRALIEPQVLRPGTMMAPMFPGGKTTRPDILEGDTERQIASIWRYLAEGEEEPVGYPPKRGAFELVATDRPRILRCFMKDVGTHTIAVGFPAKVNYAFDADSCQIEQVWRGRFVDAYSTWYTRFQEPIEPLEDDVVKLPAGRWVDDSGKPLKLQWRGYRLDKDGTPTLLIAVGKTLVEQTVTPTGDGKGLTVTATWKSAEVSPTFEPGQADGVTVKMLESKPTTLRWEYRW